MHTINKTDLPAIGAPLAGGFFAGLFCNGDQLQALIVAPKAEGETTGKWGKYSEEIEGASSYFDGRENTLAMAAAKSKIAKWALGLRIAGFDDWYLPSQDELELCYRNFKPTTEANYPGRHGINMSAEPQTRPYTSDTPTQTSIKAFQSNAPESFEPHWYWSSTQATAPFAWLQSFDGGSQGYGGKVSELCARAVRRLSVIE